MKFHKHDQEWALHLLSKVLVGFENSECFKQVLQVEKLGDSDYREAIRILNDLAGIEE